MFIELQSRRDLFLPSTPYSGTQTCARALAFVCEGQRPGTVLVAFYAPPTGFETPDMELRPQAMVQLPGGAPAHIQPNAHHEQCIVHLADPSAPAVVAVDVEQAQPLWRLNLSVSGPRPIVVGGEVLVVVDPHTQILGCDLEGHERWSMVLDDAVTAGPVERPDRPGFWVGIGDGQVLDIDPSGNTRHRWQLPNAAVGLAPGHPGVVYAHDGRFLWRLETHVPSPIWQAELPQDGDPMPEFVIDARGVAYLTDRQGGVLRVHMEGERVERLADWDSFGPPLIDYSGMVLVATRKPGGDLVAWPPSPQPPGHPPAGQPQMIPEPVLAWWAEPHGLTLISTAGTWVTLRCTT